MTEEEQIEYDRCKGDIVYFLNKYTYFYKYSPLLADYKLYPFQEDLINTIETQEKVVINNSRQMGISTTLMGYCLHKMLFNEDYHILHVNISVIQGIRDLDILKDTYSRLPEFLRVPNHAENRRKLLLDNGSFISVSNNNIGVYNDYDLVVIDNSSFIEDLESSIRELQTINSKPFKTVAASTLYKEGWFKDRCEQAELEETDFTYVKLPYYLHPKRDRQWRYNAEKDLGSVDVAKVECDCTHYYAEDMSIKPLIED